MKTLSYRLKISPKDPEDEDIDKIIQLKGID